MRAQRPLQSRRCFAGAAILGTALGCAAAGVDSGESYRRAFEDRRDPPTWRPLSGAERASFELGQAIFNTAWVPAGTPRAERRDGLGPVFNAASCDACHNNGARARGPLGDGPVPVGLVIQLADLEGHETRWGHVLNTEAIAGWAAEGTVNVQYVQRQGRYDDGRTWVLREPRYTVRLTGGLALPEQVVLKPRLAPAVFGSGLLDAASMEPVTRSHSDLPAVARFGWQADVHDLSEQTLRAFSREMGLRSSRLPVDDSAWPIAEDGAPQDREPEVSDAFVAAVLDFQRWLAVPISPADSNAGAEGRRLFHQVGCSACHVPELPVTGVPGVTRIAPYTDLRVHDLGEGLADREVGGKRVRSRWRTAPLWGLGHALHADAAVGLLHDGRARSVEEAVLWHDGEAAISRRQFERLGHLERQQVLNWVMAR